MAGQEHTVVSYYGRNISEYELVRIEESQITYENGLVNNLRRVLSKQEHRTATSPLRDPDDSHKETGDISTVYIYEQNGNLLDAKGEGLKHGWRYSDTQGWHGEHNSRIKVEYEVILGNAVATDYFEDEIK